MVRYITRPTELVELGATWHQGAMELVELGIERPRNWRNLASRGHGTGGTVRWWCNNGEIIVREW